MVSPTDWFSLYKEGWTNEIIPEAFSHPAKFARGLIRQIYQYAIEEGWLKKNDICLDPFAGVALGALDAMFNGLNWVGVELEQKFVDLGQQNIDLWNRRYGNGMLPRWGTAIILQGDSRQLVDVLKEAQGIIASPPYASDRVHKSGIDAAKFAKPNQAGYNNQAVTMNSYSTNPANLGNMREGDAEAVISSPPFQQAQSGGIGFWEGLEKKHGRQFSERVREGSHGYRQSQAGSTPGQLAAMPVAACVSSPPWEQSLTNRADESTLAARGLMPNGSRRGGSITTGDYGNSNGQLGQEQGDTFWSAARQIVEQCHQILVPGGMAIWVVKDFVRDKKRVPFCRQWEAMCQSVGFETIEWIRAWLVEDRGAQYALNGELVENRIERKSFFRRLAERKGSPRIDYEVVLCMRKS